MTAVWVDSSHRTRIIARSYIQNTIQYNENDTPYNARITVLWRLYAGERETCNKS